MAFYHILLQSRGSIEILILFRRKVLERIHQSIAEKNAIPLLSQNSLLNFIFSLPHFLCGYFLSLSFIHTHERAEISGQERAISVQETQWSTVSFIFLLGGRDEMDGRVICTGEHSAQEQSRGQWALIWLHLASVALYGYQSTGFCNGSVRCVYVRARVSACLVSFSDAWWLGRVVVNPDKTRG